MGVVLAAVCWPLSIVGLTAAGIADEAPHPSASPNATAAGVSQPNGMGRLLQRRVEASPDDGSAWRLLGHWQRQNGQFESALISLDRALELEPRSVAAHLDRAKTLIALSRSDEAPPSLTVVLDLAPDSDHGAEAAKLLASLSEGAGAVRAVNFEITRFDGTQPEPTDPLDRELRQGLGFGQGQDRDWLTAEEPHAGLARWSIFLETGVLYDTNVALSPSSRQLTPGTRQSAQGFFSPELEFRVFNTPTWRSGITFGGQFTVNEGHFSQFNVQSFRPGLFWERDIWWGDTLIIPRVQYDYGYDLFDWDRFAVRHALTGSLIGLESSGHSWLATISADSTDFADDGLVPSITSQDGWSTVGTVSREWRINQPYLQAFRLGLSAQRTDITGSDFRFQGVSITTRAKVPITERQLVLLSGSVGVRDYFDYEFTPRRDELVVRMGAEHRWIWNRHIYLACVAKYERFDSESPLFEADKIVGGLTLTYQR